jgi:hypothetical protein
MKYRLMLMAASAALAFPAGALLAAETTDAPIYGSQLMTQQERLEYRTRMQSAKTLEERERVRAEHHALMTERARERGVALPDEPPARGGGAGAGGGMGPAGGGMGPGGGGMGPGGGGMGPGGGRGR